MTGSLRERVSSRVKGGQGNGVHLRWVRHAEAGAARLSCSHERERVEALPLAHARATTERRKTGGNWHQGFGECAGACSEIFMAGSQVFEEVDDVKITIHTMSNKVPIQAHCLDVDGVALRERPVKEYASHRGQPDHAMSTCRPCVPVRVKTWCRRCSS